MNASSGCRFRSSRDGGPNRRQRAPVSTPVSALTGAPVSYGRHWPDQARDVATELADWDPGKLPGQITDQLAAWPPAGHGSATYQPPTSA
jgi:hypothetical protein